MAARASVIPPAGAVPRMLRTKRAGLTDVDSAHMRQTVGTFRRHRAPRRENVLTTRWRYSPMNWDHDPLEEDC